jgi:hypothetical protein
MVRSARGLAIRGACILAIVLGTTLVPIALAGAAGAPSAPGGVHASEDAGITTVRWRAPTSNGGSSIKRYVATARPSGATCVTRTTSCVMEHLTLGTTYTFSVVAQNAAGDSAPSADSAFHVPAAKAVFLSAVAALNLKLNADQQAINAATTTAKLSADLAKYKAAYDSFASVLKEAKWPSASRVNVAGLGVDVTTLASDTVSAYLASAGTAATLFDTLQADDNKEVVVDAKVRTELGLPPLITGPLSAGTPATPSSIGQSQTVHDFTDSALSVAVSQVIDPATAGAGSGLADSGFRFVAVVINLSDPSGGDIEGNANFSTTVLGSDGQTYTADFGTTSECQNFTYGLFELFGGDTATGCVLFQLPIAVSVQSVSFSLASNYLDTVEWEN